ncbi:VanW family protein [Paenibacillus methanolicus]|uniref:Surface rod structure-forming protein G n=1 Tax=Paenibacillus methanolicus TaxID=582686 RepID=A0A5S5CAV9_9BACL|nr:VanW family protein [Paenibacillus methanolicus]TYP75758.1 surface rod structure-forming protein G [Paenibacillus methanolicus]
MKKWHVIGIAFFAVLLAISIVWGGLWLYAKRDVVPEGARARPQTTDGVLRVTDKGTMMLGGLTVDEAKDRLRRQAAALTGMTVPLQTRGSSQVKRTWTMAELGLSVDTSGAEQALGKLREGGIWARAKYRYRFADELTVKVTWNTKLLEQKARGVWGFLEKHEPVNATRTIRADDTVAYTPHHDAYRLDMRSLTATIRARVEQAIEASAQGGTIAASGVIPMPLTVVHPNVTLAKLKAQGVERMIASFTTDFGTSGEGRAHNVISAAKSLYDWDLAPGEMFDYLTVIKATRESYGFKEAPVILNGELVPGIGGGICQVSSTLYNAALLAGLHMTERRNHSLPVSYLPMGRDATFAEGAIDFRFKNTTGKHLIIRTETSGGKLTVKLFGTLPKNVAYKLESKTVEEIEPGIKEVPSASVQPGSRLLVSPGKTGYIVETFRTKLVNGKAVATERVSRDKYKAQPAIYAIAPENAQPHGMQELGRSRKEVVEDGVTH